MTDGALAGTWFKATWVQIAAAITTALVAIVAAVLSPVAEVVSTDVWQEEIVVGQQIAVVQGSAEPLEIVLEDHSRVAGIPGGTVALEPPGDGSLEIVGPTKFRYAESATDVSPEGLQVIGRKLGNHPVKVTVTTDHGRSFEGTIDVAVTPFKPKASKTNITGDWTIVMNGEDGKMHLVQPTKERQFHGTVELGAKSYDVAGRYDGTVFQLTMKNGGAVVHRIEGIYCPLPNKEQQEFWAVNARVDTIGMKRNKDGSQNGLVEQCARHVDVPKLPGNGYFDANVQIAD